MDQHHASHHENAVDERRELAKFYLLSGSVFFASLAFVAIVGDFSWLRLGRVFMGSAWIVYAGFQLAAYREFVSAFRQYDIIAKRFSGFAYAYPFIEIAWGLANWLDVFPVIRGVSTIVIMSIGIYGIQRSMKASNSMINCACLGTIIKLPLSKLTLREDALMAIMALVMSVAEFA